MTDETITLAGEAYTIKPLVWKQLRVVTPAFGKLRSIKAAGLTEEIMTAMGQIVFHAIAPHRPGFTQDVFDNLPVTEAEIISALPIIAKQAGMKTAEDGATGEAQKAI